jgi:hypothetical protein
MECVRPAASNGSHSAGPARDHYQVFCSSYRGSAVLEQALRATASGRVRQPTRSWFKAVSCLVSTFRAPGRCGTPGRSARTSVECRLRKGPVLGSKAECSTCLRCCSGAHGVHRSDSLAARWAHNPALRPHASDSSSRSLAVMAGAFASASTS